MGGVFDDAAADIFADEDLTVAASFRRPPYAWTTLRVIRSRPSEIAAGLGPARGRAGRVQVDILAADITDTPRHGDEVRIGSTTYTVEDVESDDQALAHRCFLSDATQP